MNEPERIALARLPTPIERLSRLLPDRPIDVKRDDLTGAALSGNKIRKLEYFIAEARARGAKRVLTCGAIQSHHCRATAIAATRLGMASTLFLKAAHAPGPAEPPAGNLKLELLVGAEVRFITPEEYRDVIALMTEAAGDDGYVIPEGGSNATGAWGYIRCIDELVAQWDLLPSSIVCAAGSGGTGKAFRALLHEPDRFGERPLFVHTGGIFGQVTSATL